MSAKKRQPIIQTAIFDKIISGGQSLGTLIGENQGKKIMAWGVLPGETANILITKNKSSYCEGVIAEPIDENLLTPNTQKRIQPKDPDSYLSTSPWQIMDMGSEQFYKSALIEEAYEMQNIVLPYPIEIWTDNEEFFYRNKIEYSFWYDTDKNQLDLAFFKRGTHSKTPVTMTSLARLEITELSKGIVNQLNQLQVGGRDLKTLLIRSNQRGQTAWQLYVKNKEIASPELTEALSQFSNGEIIFSNPKSPASVITEKLWQSPSFGELTDDILNKRFSYKTEGFFQINIPVYEKTLNDIRKYITPDTPVLDLYSGVGTIGLSIASDNPLALIELNPVAVSEMKQNISYHKLEKTAQAILTPSENATDFIKADQIVIVDPPRAGVHQLVIDRLLEVKPQKIIYLSCNPVTQARDTAPLLTDYRIEMHQGYNFFPRTPHIEHLIVLVKI